MNFLARIFNIDRKSKTDSYFERESKKERERESKKETIIRADENELIFGDRNIIPKFDKKLLDQIGDEKKLLENENITSKEKLGVLQGIIMRNKKETFPVIEKFLVRLLSGGEFTNYEKMRIVDDFSRFPNGMMLIDTCTWIYYTSVELYWIIFHMDVSVLYKIQALVFILRSNMDRERKIIALKQIESIVSTVNRSDVNGSQLSDIYDALHRSGMPEADILASSVLQILNEIEEKNRPKDPKSIGDRLEERNRTIYFDSQNVHSHPIEESVERAIDVLANDVYYNCKDDGDVAIIQREGPMESMDEIQNTLSELGLITNNIRKSLNRICIDTAVFSHYQYRTRDILQKVWLRIKYKLHPNLKDEAVSILAEELSDSSSICSSGFAARIVNTLSRFTNEQGGIQAVRISWNDQIKANINARLKKIIENDVNSGDILVGMIGTDKKEYKIYTALLNRVREGIRLELLLEFYPLFGKDLSDMPILTREDFEKMFHHNYMLLYIKLKENE